MLSEFAKRVANKFKAGWRRLFNRIGLWVTKGHSAFNKGQLFQIVLPTEDEPRLEWRIGNTEESCTDCLALDGVVLTVSEWQRIGISPQSPQLECGGWNCDCGLYPTDKPSIGLANVRV